MSTENYVISYDLSTTSGDRDKAYERISLYMRRNGFKRVQQSVFLSRRSEAVSVQLYDVLWKNLKLKKGDSLFVARVADFWAEPYPRHFL